MFTFIQMLKEMSQCASQVDLQLSLGILFFFIALLVSENSKYQISFSDSGSGGRFA